MQLIRARLHAATCALLAVAGGAVAGEGDWQAEAAALTYAEQGRTTVFEPAVRVKRNFVNGQSLAVKLVFDAMTGASPNGAMPTDHAQTFTSPSGTAFQIPIGETPVRDFTDQRGAVELEYEHPLTRTFKAVAGGHLSAETDYTSTGATLTFTLDTPNRLTTFTAGAGANWDQVSPNGGVPTGLGRTSTAIADPEGSTSKRALDGLVGITQVLSRHWLVQCNYGRARESGYLTEPYKVVSTLLPDGSTVDYRHEKRPSKRERQNAFLGTVYQLWQDVVHISYRYYWDDWQVRSHTVEVHYRHALPGGHFIEPQVRYYSQSAVGFYTYGLISGVSLPEYATSDYRYGKLKTMTIGLKYGLPVATGEFSLRVEYMRQSGERHPREAIGVQKNYDLFPPINIMILQLAYSLDF
jgi:hypothetical protein